jgi:hypothetical protein
MSERPLIQFMGFFLFFLFPGTALVAMMLGYFSPAPAPVTLPAALYPIGLVYLMIYPPLIYKPGMPVAGTSYMKFAEGAWIGGVAIAILSLFAAAVLSLFNQAIVGFSLAAVSVGSLWLPAAPGATGLSFFLAGKGVSTSGSTSRNPSRFRAVDGAFLALFLGRFRLFARNLRIPVTLAVLLGLYLLGWVELSFRGGYPFTIFGIVMPVLLFASCYITIRRTLRPEDLPKILSSLTRYTPSSQMLSKGNVLLRFLALAAFLIVVSLLVWLWKP